MGGFRDVHAVTNTARRGFRFDLFPPTAVLYRSWSGPYTPFSSSFPSHLSSRVFLNMRRRTFHIYLSLLAAVLLGTIIVLASFSYYLAIDNAAYLTEEELDAPDYDSRWNASQHGKIERIPRILHQTWKTETLPIRWQGVSDGCRAMMPD